MSDDQLIDLIWNNNKHDEPGLSRSMVAAIIGDVLEMLKVTAGPKLSQLFIDAEGGLPPPPPTKKPATGKKRRGRR